MSTTEIIDTQAVLDGVPTGLWIGGESVDASDAGTFTVYDPATEQPLTQVADATVEDARRALDVATSVADDWAATPARERGEILRRAFGLVADRTDDLAMLMTLELGRALPDSLAEARYGNEFLRWFAEEAVRIDGRFTQSPAGTGRIVVTHAPVGPCLALTPWNFPLAMGTRKIGPALAAGTVMLVKPAHETPLTMLALAEIFAEAGLPAGVLSVLPTMRAREVASAIIGDDRIRKISFTGSTPVGKNLLGQAAERVQRTSMELGGNAPFVVFDDADLDKAVEGALLAKFRNIGQACTAANRFIVHESVADEFARRVTERVAAMKVGRGTEEGVQIGPLIDADAVAKADELVRDAADRGATVLTGGEAVEGTGTFYRPTVVSGVAPGSAILREEIFGPVLAIATFADEDEAVRLANDTEYGLVSYVFTEDLGRGMRMIDALETGMMGLNVGVVSNAAAPFGGVKQSGVGREGGFEGIHEYLSTKYTLIPIA